MSKLGRIGTCISLDIETKSMFNDLKMQGVNMSESIRNHIRWLYASRMGHEPKTWVEHHWESLQSDKREFEDALAMLEEQQDRFIRNLPRNIAMHEKSKSIATELEKQRYGKLQHVRDYINLRNKENRSDREEILLGNLESKIKDFDENWDYENWGIKPDFYCDDALEDILEEVKLFEENKFIRNASIDQIEIMLEADGKIPDLIAGNIAKHLLHEGGEL